jgi:hypothetical protein
MIHMRKFNVLLAALGLVLIGMLTVAGQSVGAMQGAFVTNTPQVPTATLSPTVASLPTITPIPPERITTLTITGQMANVRAEPSTEADILTSVGRGSNFPILGEEMMSDGLWYQIALDDDQSGWVFHSLGALVLVWSPVVKTIGDVEMALVPPDCFLMGSETGEDDEKPVNLQCFDQPFWIDRYEVTNADYGSVGYWTGDENPRESVSWSEAQAYCAERGARLPTEAEWEYAARGPYAFVYPWGDEFIDENAVSSWLNTARETLPVGSRPDGASWVGALDMSGNVWEWTSTIYADYPYDPTDGRENPDDSTSLRLVRGGSCCSYVIADVRSAYRFPADPNLEDPNIGFRCVRSD